MLEKKSYRNELETVILVGLVHSNFREEQILEYLNELEFLANTAGALVLSKVIQKLDVPNYKTFIGKGKLEEIENYLANKKVDTVIFDDELTASQLRNIQEILKIRIIDRPTLILDIFAKRAKTNQAKVQVELAQYQFLLPRLKGMWKHLERQGGGIGTRGPGETEIETDKRIVQNKIFYLKKQLKQITKQSNTQRKERVELIRVILVGYTNVGKSTIMNVISKSSVLAEDKLFATLDATTRRVFIDKTPFLLSDTIGFIRKLPHHLVDSFRTTLQEVKDADILLNVVDISHSHFEEQIEVVNQTLNDLDIKNKRIIIIFNKMDKYEIKNFDKNLDQNVKKDLLSKLKTELKIKTKSKCLFISALNKEDINNLKKDILQEVIDLYKIRYPYKVNFF